MPMLIWTYIVVSYRFEPAGPSHSQLEHALDVPDRIVAGVDVAWCCKCTALEQRLELCVVLAKRVLADGVCVLCPLVHVRLGGPVCWTTTATGPA